jgi:hypothetical protein
MKTIIRNSALALAAAGMAVSVPAAARDHGHHNRYEQSHRDRYGNDTRYYGRNYHSERIYQNTRTWRGNDGRYYCRKKDGTTGLIVGAAAGALLGRAVDGGYNHTTGTILGGVVGALLGKSVAQGTTCR